MGNISVARPFSFIPADSEPSGCLQTFGDCREGQRPVACSGVIDFVDSLRITS